VFFYRLLKQVHTIKNVILVSHSLAYMHESTVYTLLDLPREEAPRIGGSTPLQLTQPLLRSHKILGGSLLNLPFLCCHCHFTSEQSEQYISLYQRKGNV